MNATQDLPGFVQRVLDIASKQPAFKVRPHSRNGYRTSWVRWTNWGLGMSYAAYMVYPMNSPCLYSPVSMLIYKELSTLSSKRLISWVTKPGNGGCTGRCVKSNTNSHLYWDGTSFGCIAILRISCSSPDWDMLYVLWRWWENNQQHSSEIFLTVTNPVHQNSEIPNVHSKRNTNANTSRNQLTNRFSYRLAKSNSLFYF